MSKLKNYTTSVPAMQSVGEIQAILAKHGITDIGLKFADGKPTGITFTAFLLGKPQKFEIECKAQAVLGVLQASKVEPRYRTVDHATNVGWRILKDLIDAQMASVAIEQMELAQAFFGFALDASGKTSYQIFIENRQKQLTEGKQ
ncbi:MAG TPA: hypothetical protein VIL74_08855 [Pyrinomonadaceae bacterium]|jgi:hypothetical protein